MILLLAFLNMHVRVTSILLFSILSLSAPLSLSSPTDDNPDNNRSIDQWCAETPHPHSCMYYFAHNPPTYLPNQTSDFFYLSLQLTIDATNQARSLLEELSANCNSSTECVAVMDCWKLYVNAELQLNRTLDYRCTHIDSQTWLSAALTNLATCLKGFVDIRASDSLINPIVSYNVSNLVSNLLAINKANNVTNDTMGFTKEEKKMSWMKTAHRKLLQLSSSQANLVVAQDGSGNVGTIKEALNAAATQISAGQSNGNFVIYVKAGVYIENLQVVSSLSNLVLIGAGIGKTIITGNQSVVDGFTTFSSATFSVFGDAFMATQITFRNTYGPTSQAVAMLSASDRSIFYKCSFEGYQDTLSTFSQRQFYRECDIYGTIDFIFGNAAVVFQKCNIYARIPVLGQANVITAQGRSDPNQNTGIVIQSSNIAAAPEFWPIHRTVKSYLGRPWQKYSRTVYVRNYIESIIDPTGWVSTVDDFEDTLYFAEFGNTGPGSRLSLRVNWTGYHLIGRQSLVYQFSASRFIAGRVWIPLSNVPFDPVF